MVYGTSDKKTELKNYIYVEMIWCLRRDLRFDPSMDTIISNLTSDLVIILEWFNMKKFQMMLLGHDVDQY